MRTWILLLASQVAFGHARVVRTAPADGATLDETPTELRLWFDSEVERRFNRFELHGPDGSERSLEAFVPEADDPTQLGAKLGTLGPGSWRVAWDVVSRDGHRVEGTVRFEVRSRQGP